MTTWALPSGLDRADQQRDSVEWVARQWHSEAAQVLGISADVRFALTPDGAGLQFGRPAGEFDPQRCLLLGVRHDQPVFAVEGPVEGESTSLREVGGRLSADDRDIAAAASAITHWHRMEPCCPQCGGSTRVVNGGFARHCDECGHDHFPRTDPAVIVAVIDDRDRLLLGGQATWGNRVSVLAGFVEAGESAEQAVHREIAEEVAVGLGELAYFGSQPWPFPRSLMLGYFARAVTTEVNVDADEIAYADWYTRSELDARLAAGTVALPGPSSIAARLIQTWREGANPL